LYLHFKTDKPFSLLRKRIKAIQDAPDIFGNLTVALDQVAPSANQSPSEIIRHEELITEPEGIDESGDTDGRASCSSPVRGSESP